MEKSFPFNAVITDGVADRVYTAEDFAAERAEFVSNGITTKEGLFVSPAAEGGMAVDIAPGAAVINGHTYFNTSTLTLSLAESTAPVARIDMIVLRLDSDAHRIYAAVKTGTPELYPTAPICAETDTVYEIPLAEVYVDISALTVTEANVADRRVRADYILSRMEIDEMVAEYKAALEAFFTDADAEKLALAADIFRTDAGAEKVLCGDGKYRDFATAGRVEELVRFTQNGLFSPADYPTKDGRYTIEVQGAGGSGAAGAYGVVYGGGAGGYARVDHLPLDSTKSYYITIGKGGSAPYASSLDSATVGNAGGASSFGRIISAGGGRHGATSQQQALTIGAYTAESGTTVGGGSSPFGAGGETAEGIAGTNGGLGAGGGASTLVGAYAGKGGDGVVVISGYPV